MRFRNNMTAVLSAAGILALILDSRTALSGAASGIELCLKSILPSLFPFLFLCTVMADSIWGSQSTVLRFLGKKTGIPNGAESLLIAAALGGYPAGAQAVAAAFRSGKLNRQDAEHLLRFCNNAGPSFLFGIISSQFQQRSMVWALFAIHLLSALWTGSLHANTTNSSAVLQARNSTIPETLKQSVKTMSFVCGWIVLFRILTEYLTKWVFCLVPGDLQVVFAGMLELSNGCCALSLIDDPCLRFLACSCLLAFGGLCVTMQTASVIEGLSLKAYLQGKAVQILVSFLLSLLYLHYGWISLITALILFAAVPKKTVDFQSHRMYNKSKMRERDQLHAVS